MADFTVRVVLHDADWDDYEALHGHMEDRGFVRTITGKDGTVYQLPDAEYDLSGDFTRDAALALAKEAAALTKKKHGILVTESKGRSWSGLARA